MRKFNFDGYSMIRRTEEDNKIILDYLEQEVELFVDEYDRIWTESGVYIADIVKTELGSGLFC